jgi:hypothetical protein
MKARGGHPAEGSTGFCSPLGSLQVLHPEQSCCTCTGGHFADP